MIGFDPDDTLWHNESICERTRARQRTLLAYYRNAATVDRTLLATEMRHLEFHDYGEKGVMLSAIETAIQLTAGGRDAAIPNCKQPRRY